MRRQVAVAAAAMFGASGIAFSTNPRDESRARELFVDVCTSCHTLARVSNQALSKEEWRAFIRGMVSEGAAVSEEEMDLIAGYLGEHYGDKKQ